jgi:NTE family protein
LLILLAPQLQEDVGQSMEAIASRIQELGFTTHFLREMQMLAYGASRQSSDAVNQSRFHMIDAGNLEAMRRSDTKMLAYSPFLEMLRDDGRKCAQNWLAENLQSIGRRGTLDWSQWTCAGGPSHSMDLSILKR